MRVGVVTKKLGMSTVFNAESRMIPVTLLKIDDCQVVGFRDKDKDGAVALRVGHGKAKANQIKKPLKGHFIKNKVDFKRHIVDFKISQDALLDIGAHIRSDHYVVGQFIDVTGTSTGKGFAGPMKRHGFRGLRASHGVSISHRSHGSTGQCQDPGKTFKGKKMAGHMGNKKVTTGSLEIIDIDKKNNILVVKGSVPGHKNSYVLVRDAVKKGLPAGVPYPGVKADSEAGKANSDANDAAVEVIQASQDTTVQALENASVSKHLQQVDKQKDAAGKVDENPHGKNPQDENPQNNKDEQKPEISGK